MVFDNLCYHRMTALQTMSSGRRHVIGFFLVQDAETSESLSVNYADKAKLYVSHVFVNMSFQHFFSIFLFKFISLKDMSRRF